MSTKVTKASWYKSLYMLMLAGAVAVNLKSIFTDFDIDSEYAMVMSFRMIKGDRMFLQMWEPHQTSAFLGAILMRIYMALTGSTTGIAIFLNAAGVFIHSGITGILYKTLKRYLSKENAVLMSLFYLTVRPKDIILPEFSNMQLWFSTLLLCCILRYYLDQKRKLWLVFASVCLSLEIISYPSCLIVYLILVFILIKYSCDRGKDILLVTISCAVQGCVYILYFLVRIGYQDLLYCIRQIITGDDSHQTAFGGRLVMYGENIFAVVLYLSICLALSYVLVKIYTMVRKRRGDKETADFRRLLAGAFFLILFLADFINIIFIKDRFIYLSIYIPILLLLFYGLRCCPDQEKMMVCISVLLSFGSFTAVLMLTNLHLFATMKYLNLAVAAAFVPVSHLLEAAAQDQQRRYLPAILFCCVTILHTGIIIKPLDGVVNSNIFDIRGIVTKGPCRGIITDYMGAYISNKSVEDWEKYVRDGDRIMLVGGADVSTQGYLYSDTEVCIDSTICTPTYNEKLLDYWNLNPDKMPNVVIVRCWFGELRVDENSWIMDFIEREYQSVSYVDGMYWRFYRLAE